MQFELNGQPQEVADNPDAPLLWTLRDELGQTGTKYGCGVGICGACTIQVDGVAQRACITPTGAVEGASVKTIEGMATVDEAGQRTLHPVQQAFIDQQVPQCGWCMSGQIMQAAAFLAQNTSPSEDEINGALENNYCRCGCYVRIKRAVAQAAAELMVNG